MTTTTVTAGRILKGQLEGREGEASTLAIDTMHYSGFSKVSFNVGAFTIFSKHQENIYLHNIITTDFFLTSLGQKVRNLVKLIRNE